MNYFGESDKSGRSVVLICDRSEEDHLKTVLEYREKLLEFLDPEKSDFPEDVTAQRETNAIIHVVFVGHTPDQDLIYKDITAKAPLPHDGVLIADLAEDDPVRISLGNERLERHRGGAAIIDAFGVVAAMSSLRERRFPVVVVEPQTPLPDLTSRLFVGPAPDLVKDYLQPPFPIPSLLATPYKDHRHYALPWERKNKSKRKRRR